MDQRHQRATAAGAYRMPQCYDAAVHVHLFVGDVQVLHGGQRDYGEGFVDLEEVDVRDLQ